MNIIKQMGNAKCNFTLFSCRNLNMAETTLALRETFTKFEDCIQLFFYRDEKRDKILEKSLTYFKS